MPKMTDSQLGAILSAEKADALAAMQASKLSEQRQKAQKYYNGDVSDDLPGIEGRSQVVSTDVSDTVEGLMPSLMEIFCGSDEVVKFEPVGPDDVQAAEQETDYVNHVFMQQNPGFLVLYSFIKDALLSKVGIVKIFWEKKEHAERETYFDLDDDAFAALAASEEVEIVEHSEHDAPASYQPDPVEMGDIPPEAAEQMLNAAQAGQPLEIDAQGTGMAPADLAGRLQAAGPAAPEKLHDVTVETKKTYACARVEPVPPEEFGIARSARSVRDADYCFHEVIRTEDDLIGQGYDPEQVRALPTFGLNQNSEKSSRDTVDESSASEGDRANKALRQIQVTEHYVRMDYEGTGKARLYRVTTGGEQAQILTRDGKPDIVEEDMIRFAAMTPVIVTHRFFGRSIADLVMDIQRIKTALLRAMLDNAYVVSNPRPVVSEEDSNENTLDDLLVSAHGRMIRVARNATSAVAWQTVPAIGKDIFPLIEYQDARLEQRSGVTRQGQGIDADALQNQSATAVNQLYSASQARIKLIARIFAETGMKDLFWLLHATIRKNGKKAETVRLRKQWVKVDPRNWKHRNDLVVNVGLGSGGKSERIAHLMAMIGLQKEAVAAGKTNIVSDKNLYNSARELTKLLEYKDVENYFTDPETQPPLQQQPDPKMIEVQAKLAMQERDGALKEREFAHKKEIEVMQAQADIASNDRRVQADIVLKEKDFELKRELALIQAGLQERQHEREMQRGEAQHAMGMAEKQADQQRAERDHELTAGIKQQDFQQRAADREADREAKKAEAKTPKPEPKPEPKAKDEGKPDPAMAAAITALAQGQAAIAEALKATSKPRKRTITTPSGKKYSSEED